MSAFNKLKTFLGLTALGLSLAATSYSQLTIDAMVEEIGFQPLLGSQIQLFDSNTLTNQIPFFYIESDSVDENSSEVFSMKDPFKLSHYVLTDENGLQDGYDLAEKTVFEFDSTYLLKSINSIKVNKAPPEIMNDHFFHRLAFEYYDNKALKEIRNTYSKGIFSSSTNISVYKISNEPLPNNIIKLHLNDQKYSKDTIQREELIDFLTKKAPGVYIQQSNFKSVE